VLQLPSWSERDDRVRRYGSGRSRLARERERSRPLEREVEEPAARLLLEEEELADDLAEVPPARAEDPVQLYLKDIEGSRS
jgi:hypothetical protein